MAISKFKATCLSVLDRVKRTGQPILVTRRGAPIAEIVPPSRKEPDLESAYGCMEGTAEELEDILEPLPETDWIVLR